MECYMIYYKTLTPLSAILYFCFITQEKLNILTNTTTVSCIANIASLVKYSLVTNEKRDIVKHCVN